MKTVFLGVLAFGLAAGLAGAWPESEERRSREAAETKRPRDSGRGEGVSAPGSTAKFDPGPEEEVEWVVEGEEEDEKAFGSGTPEVLLGSSRSLVFLPVGNTSQWLAIRLVGLSPPATTRSSPTLAQGKSSGNASVDSPSRGGRVLRLKVRPVEKLPKPSTTASPSTSTCNFTSTSASTSTVTSEDEESSCSGESTEPSTTTACPRTPASTQRHPHSCRVTTSKAPPVLPAFLKRIHLHEDETPYPVATPIPTSAPKRGVKPGLEAVCRGILEACEGEVRSPHMAALCSTPRLRDLVAACYSGDLVRLCSGSGSGRAPELAGISGVRPLGGPRGRSLALSLLGEALADELSRFAAASFSSSSSSSPSFLSH